MNKYIKGGEQTELTERIKNISEKLIGDGFDLVEGTLKWIHKNLKTKNDPELKNKIFRTRTADQIIKDGFVTGCTDSALVFLALIRAKGVPAKYVETIRRRWLEVGDDDFIEGHIFSEVYINGKWYIIDPAEGQLLFWYNRWVVYDRGLDSWDIGIHNMQELKDKFTNFKDNYKNNKKTEQ